MQIKLAIALAIGFAVVAAGTASAAVTQQPARTASAYLAPTTMSPACQSDAQRAVACQLIRGFFRAVNSGRFGAACGLLGQQLRSDSYGMSCPRFLALATPEPMPWGILGAKLGGPGVSVLVTLGQSELDHIRMRMHRAFVGLEHGRLKILQTRLVR